MFARPAFSLDTQICTGCKTCIIACRDKNNLPGGVRWRRVVEFSGGDWIQLQDGTVRHTVFAYYLSVSCNHCQDPICVTCCPSGAMTQDRFGIVSINPETCIGCRYCEWACPYSAPQFDPVKGRMTKCDFCRDDLVRDKTPACVAACPTRALGYGELDQLIAQYGNNQEMAPLPHHEFTQPCLVLILHGQAKSLQTKDGLIRNPEEIRNA